MKHKSLGLLQCVLLSLSLGPRHKKLKRLLSHIQLCLLYTHTHTQKGELEQYTDCKIVSSVCVWSTACVCLRYYCRHAWEVFICWSLLPKSCRERKREREGGGEKTRRWSGETRQWGKWRREWWREVFLAELDCSWVWVRLSASA